MKKEIEMLPCKCSKDMICEIPDVTVQQYGHIIGCCNLDCDVGHVIGFGSTLDAARRSAIEEWNKMVSK